MIVARIATPDDIEGIVALTDEIFRTSHGLRPSMGNQFPLFLCKDNAANLYIAEDNGRIISHMGIKRNDIFICGCRLSMASMGAVCTHPDYQGHGIASMLMEQTLLRLYEQHVDLLTVSGLRTLYTRHECIKTGGCIHFSSAIDLMRPLSVLPYAYVEVKPSDMTALSAIYQREAVRYKRSAWEFPVLIEAMPLINKYPVFNMVITAKTDDDRAAAYVIFAESEIDHYNVVEYAGERCAVGGIIANVLSNRLKGSLLSIDVPMWDKDMLYVLRSMGLKGEEDFQPSIYRVIDREQLWRDLLPLVEERSYQRLNYDLPEAFAQDVEGLTHFLFDIYQRGRYDEQWSGIVPVPLPLATGLNYI